MSRVSEISNEIRHLVAGRAGVADGIVPPIVFVTVNAFAGVTPAAIAGLGVAALIVVWRLARGHSPRFAFSGMAGTALAVGLALRSGRAEDYFLPGIVSGALMTLGILWSLAARKPLVAWTSWIARSWPLDWYWHPRVRPAYMLVTWLWAGFFGLRTAVQWWLFQAGSIEALGVFRAVSGWPALLILLVITYLLGRSRLVALEGPSVEEFEALAPPPWKGQPTGF